MSDLDDYYQNCGIPKPEPRKAKKSRLRAETRDRHELVRVYVKGRERDWCRCCRWRRGQSMHEIRFRSLRGKVSKQNSIWVCGDIVGAEQSCHTYLQNHQIDVSAGARGAEGPLLFKARTQTAADWMRVEFGLWIESVPGSQLEAE